VAEVQGSFDIPPHKVRVSRHGHYIGAYPDFVSREAARDALGLAEGDDVILFTGQIRPYKGAEALIGVVRRLLAERPRAVLLLAGVMQFDLLAEVTPALTEAERARIRTTDRFLDDMEMQLFFRAADVAVYPYQKILTSGSLMLALSFGVPDGDPPGGDDRRCAGRAGRRACSMTQRSGPGRWRRRCGRCWRPRTRAAWPRWPPPPARGQRRSTGPMRRGSWQGIRGSVRRDGGQQTGRTKPYGAAGMTAQLMIFGHSHVWSVRRALGLGWQKDGVQVAVPICGTKEFPGPVIYELTDGRTALNPVLVAALNRVIDAGAHDQTWLVSMTQGNFFNQLGMVAEGGLFDFVLASRPDLLLTPGAVVLPAAALREMLTSWMVPVGQFLSILVKFPFGRRIIVVGPPPPPEDQAVIEAMLAGDGARSREARGGRRMRRSARPPSVSSCGICKTRWVPPIARPMA
jgi:hypothetical protein